MSKEKLYQVEISPRAMLSLEGLEVSRFDTPCPVQCVAQLKDSGEWLYFRARYESWSIAIANSLDEAVQLPERDLHFYHTEEWGEVAFDAGGMPLEDAARLIIEQVRKYRLQKSVADAEDQRRDLKADIKPSFELE